MDIYIFGSGMGAQRYYSFISRESDVKVLGFLDNDSSKLNSKLLGLNIYSPDILKSVSFEQIHIASMWSSEISEQLINDYRIKKDRIVILPKSKLKEQVKPFDSEVKQLNAKKIINNLCDKFRRASIPLFLDGGCLLGIFRDGKLIPWDDDIDFMFERKYIKDALSVLSIFSESCSDQYDIGFSGVMNENSHFFSMLFFPKLDCLSFVEINFNVGRRVGNNINLKDGMFYIPNKYTNSLIWIDINPGAASTFYNAEEYLSFMYGDWRTVRQDWSFSDYKNLVKS
jgi:lipopolysaccharide cholinephosphotransferase